MASWTGGTPPDPNALAAANNIPLQPLSNFNLQNFLVRAEVTAVPEPSSVLLVGTVFLAATLGLRKRLV